ncbi:hypothetical protein VNO78_08037 [Psophocarpus tetragonolobus]|uniref:Uncharacterized protein n=1 Tax=Psophocarpus tetragonolobus TaxID=3891 RepID=A0AAN9T4C2_PSOTE
MQISKTVRKKETGGERRWGARGECTGDRHKGPPMIWYDGHLIPWELSVRTKCPIQGNNALLTLCTTLLGPLCPAATRLIPNIISSPSSHIYSPMQLNSSFIIGYLHLQYQNQHPHLISNKIFSISVLVPPPVYSNNDT